MRKSKILAAIGLFGFILFSGCNSDTTPTLYISAPNVSPSPQIMVNTPVKRYVSIGGRTVVKSFLGVNNGSVPLAGVTVSAIIDGTHVDATSDAGGFWAFTNIPARMTGAAQDATNNVTIIFNLTGFQTATQSINLIELAASQQEIPSLNYQVDLGDITLQQQSLMFQSNLVRVWNNGGNYTTWVGTGNAVGAANADAENVYLASPSATITLTFNFPVDTVRAGTQFILLKSPTNLALIYTGSWNSTGTVFTITPAASLIPSPFKADKYTLSFIGPVWTTGTIYQQVALSGATVSFNVMDVTSELPLTSQAPVLAPEADVTPNVTGYTMGDSTILKSGIVTTGGLSDVITHASGITIRYNTNPGRTYKVYSRNIPAAGYSAASSWTNRTADCTSASYPDSTATCQLANIFAYTSGAAAPISNGEILQFIVTSLKGLEESQYETVATPLALSDTQKPFLVTPTTVWNKATATAPRAELGVNVVTGRATFTFSEIMQSPAPSATPMSGGLTAFSQNTGTGRWLAMNQYAQDLTLTFAVPQTTLAQAHNPGQTRIKVANLGTASSRFVVGDKINIGATTGTTNNSQYRETRTIAAIDTYNSVITIDALVNVHASTEGVFLVDSAAVNPGLTYFASTTAATVRAGATSVTLAAGTGSKFYKGQGLSFYRLDAAANGGAIAGYLPTVTAVVASISTDTVTFTAPLSDGITAGSIVMDSGVSVAEPAPRAAVALTSTDKIMFDTSNTATTSLSNDQFANNAPEAKPNQITVSPTTGITGIFVGDVITIAASTVSDTTGAAIAQLGTSLTVATGKGADFRVGDIIELQSIAPSALTVAANATTTKNASGTTLNLSAAADVRAGDILRFYEAAATTTVKTAVPSAIAVNQPLVVASTAGFAVGQTVTYDDRVLAPISVTVTSIDSTSGLQVSGLTATQIVPAGAVLYKPEMGEDFLPTSDTTTTVVTSTSGFAAGSGYSPAASVTQIRPYRRATVSAIASDVLTISAIGGGFPSGATVKLVSEAEQFVVTASAVPTMYSLTLSGNLQFPHRAGAAVTKATQASFITGAGLLNSVMVGDTVIIEQSTLADVNAKGDRFSATVIALDSASRELTLTPTLGLTQSIYYDFNRLPNYSIETMGDAMSVSGYVDSSGNSCDTNHDFRMDIQGTAVR